MTTQQSLPVISKDLYSLLNQYVKTGDILEDPNFDAISYLNKKFPDLEGLDNLPAFIEDCEKKLKNVDEQLDTLICERAKYSDEMKHHINEMNSMFQK